MFRHAVLLLLVCSLTLNISAQKFGATPPSVSWKQIQTKDFNIIFPKGLDSTANHIASVIWFSKDKMSKTIGGKVLKIPIILRNTGLESNGFVALAPYRSEFYLNPPASPVNTGSMPWTDLLALHEYRHAQQYSNFNTGASHLMRIIFGEEGQVLANAAAVPDWFFEGDAVYAETEFGQKGRGQIPSFYDGFRALWQTGKQYSWMKLRNGSYRDFVPDKYILGYMLVNYGKEKFGEDFWKKVTQDASSFRPLFYPFQANIKKYSGVSFKEFSANSMSKFRNQFNDPKAVQPGPDYFTNEQSPVFDESGRLIYLKSSAKSIPEFSIIEEGKERRIRTADVMTDSYFTYNDGKIYYSSIKPHVRWGYIDFNEIQVLDIETGTQTTLTHNTRYFSPAPDETGKSIVAVDASEDQNISLHLLDAATGTVIRKYTHPDVIQYYHPLIYKDKIISAVTNKTGQMSLMEFDIESGSTDFFLPLGEQIISYPFVKGDTLFFSSTYGMNDELFALVIPDRKLFRIETPLTSLGKYQVNISKDSVVWSTRTAQGLRLQKVALSELSYIPVTIENYIAGSGLLKSLEKIDFSAHISTFKDSTFEVKKYSRFSKPFNFHSLEPGTSDPEYSLNLIGENVLGTIQSQAGFTFNNADRSKTTSFSLLYGGWFPVISASYAYSFDRHFVKNNKRIFFNESGPEFGLSIPLNLSKGRSFTGLTLGSRYHYKSLQPQKGFKSEFGGLTYSYLSHSVSFYTQSRQALAQVLPRWGQSFSFKYNYGLSGVTGRQFLTTARFLFPGFSATHSFNFRAGYAAKDTLRQISFSNSFPFARGYNSANLYRMYGVQLNYQLPLIYPEAGVANIVYWARSRGNIFFDYTTTRSFDTARAQISRDFKSAGVEIFFDTRWWNQAAISFGFRFTRLLTSDLFEENRKNRFEFILPVNIFNK